MSLDVYLYGPEQEVDCTCECGHCHKKKSREELYSANITHNLGKMAAQAGIYCCLWRPEEDGLSKARDLIAPMKKGLELLESDPKRFSAFNAENNWGTYKDFVPWIRCYLDACIENPDADAEVSR